MKWLPVLALGLILLALLAAGCSSPPLSSPPPVYSPSSPIRVVVAGTNDEWSLSLGCYTIVTGYAYNTGTVSVDNAIVYLTLVYQDGTIRDSTSVFLGTIEPQGSKSYQVILDRECGKEYSVNTMSS